MEIGETDKPPTQLNIIGCGDIGRRVAQLYIGAETTLNAWVKTDHSLALCKSLGLHTKQIDFDAPFEINSLEDASHILYTVPPPAQGTQDPRLARFLARLDPKQTLKFVLISTTGVYGDCAGQWIDESTPLNPVADRALRRADAERHLLAWASKTRPEVIILRVPGIYASDRLPLARLKKGRPTLRRTESPWSNRIHADDLARACYAALGARLSNEIINVTDDAPSTMTDYFSAIADYAGLPYPPEISLAQAKQQMSAGLLSYLLESRRIKNDKMKRLLHISLRYPSLAHGLRKSGQPSSE